MIKNTKHLVTNNKMILVGIGIAILWWFFEAMMDTHVFQEGPFIERFFPALDPNELWMRLLPVCLFVGFGIYAKSAASKLMKMSERLSASNQRLRASEEYFRDFFANAPVGFHIFGPDRVITDINEAELAMIGYTRDEVVGKKIWAALIIPVQRDRFEKHWQDIITKGQVRDLEYTLVHKDGHNINVVLNASSRFDEHSNLINTRGSVLDITECKQAENELEKAKHELETRVQDRTKELATTVEVLQSEVAERKRLEREVLEISEEEQRRIGRELHDGLQQELVGMTFECQLLHKKLTAKSLPEAGDAARIHRFLNDAIDHTRAITRMLYPIDLDSKDISFALRQLAARVKSLFHISCQFTCKKTLVVKRPDVAINIYRIVQEAVTNAIKHGKADSISINLKSSKNRITFTIRDNGTGLAADYEETEGMGLRIMKYRASMIGASLNIRSGTKSPGTLVTCSFESREDKL